MAVLHFLIPGRWVVFVDVAWYDLGVTYTMGRSQSYLYRCTPPACPILGGTDSSNTIIYFSWYQFLYLEFKCWAGTNAILPVMSTVGFKISYLVMSRNPFIYSPKD